MFLTAPAGLGKSTAMRWQNSCVAIGVMWYERTFLFTVYTGSAASLIGGIAISKTAYINQQKQLSADDIN